MYISFFQYGLKHLIGNERHLIRIGYFLGEVWAELVLFVLFLITFFLVKRIKKEKILLVLSLVFLAGSIVVEYILNHTRTRGREMLLIVLEFITVPRFLPLHIPCYIFSRETRNLAYFLMAKTSQMVYNNIRNETGVSNCWSTTIERNCCYDTNICTTETLYH